MITLRDRVNVLVPDAKCFIQTVEMDGARVEEIVEWKDSRPRPSDEDLLAVTEQQLSSLRTSEQLKIANAELRKAGAAILEAVFAQDREDAFWLVIFSFIKDPTLYSNAGQLKTAVQAATKYKIADDLKQDALQRLIAKL